MENTPQVSERLVTARQLAGRLRVPATWIKQEAEAGRIPCIRAGREYLFDAETVAAMLLERAKSGEGVAQ
jgi:hypothetical protein